MNSSQMQYVTDVAGHRVGVLIDLEQYHQLLEAVEELEAIRAYDAAKESADEGIPFDQAIEEIERERSGR